MSLKRDISLVIQKTCIMGETYTKMDISLNMNPYHCKKPNLEIKFGLHASTSKCVFVVLSAHIRP